MLDRLKQKEATKRVFFLHNRTFQYSKNMLVSNGKRPACEEQDVFLRVRRRRVQLLCTPMQIRPLTLICLSVSVRTTASSGTRSLPSPW